MNPHNTTSLTLTLLLTIVAPVVGQSQLGSGPVTAGPSISSLPHGGMVAHVEDNISEATVKGTPFCAAVTTEHTQSLADGNRIHTVDSSSLCRDRAGRTRSETTLNLLDANLQGSSPRLVTIVDPVAGTRYMLDPENKVAHKMTLNPPGSFSTSASDSNSPAKGDSVFFSHNPGGLESSAASANVVFRKAGQSASEPAESTENLGEQTINGIRATGTRMTTTIPSGNVGNDRAINVTSERWYSSELKATIMTKHADPWAGELKTEFTSVDTSDPDPSLFIVPGDYKILDDKNGPFRIQMAAPASLPQ
jgi:hypothetical protein